MAVHIGYLKEHYRYEIDMLNYTYKSLETCDDKNLCNVFIESFAIHARVLYEFFQSPEPRKDDIIATMFTQEDFISEMNVSKSILTKINKQIQHLTAERFAAAEFKFNCEERRALFDAITTNHHRFVNALKPEFAGELTI